MLRYRCCLLNSSKIEPLDNAVNSIFFKNYDAKLVLNLMLICTKFAPLKKNGAKKVPLRFLH